MDVYSVREVKPAKITSGSTRPRYDSLCAKTSTGSSPRRPSTTRYDLGADATEKIVCVGGEGCDIGRGRRDVTKNDVLDQPPQSQHPRAKQCGAMSHQFSLSLSSLSDELVRLNRGRRQQAIDEHVLVGNEGRARAPATRKVASSKRNRIELLVLQQVVEVGRPRRGRPVANARHRRSLVAHPPEARLRQLIEGARKPDAEAGGAANYADRNRLPQRCLLRCTRECRGRSRYVAWRGLLTLLPCGTHQCA